VIELSALNGAANDGGTSGLIISGINAFDNSGFSVSNAGDVNGDGIDDLLIGAAGVDPNSSNSGQSYVVFGQSDDALPAVIELSALNGAVDDGGTPGLTINGINANDSSGSSVSNAGDVNFDGIDDLLIGASFASPNGSGSGQSYVVFGQSGGALPAVIELSALNGVASDGGTPGLAINGINAFDNSSNSVSNAGDVNGDGIDDLLIGSYNAYQNRVGQAYIIFGSGADLSITKVNNAQFVNGIDPVTYFITASNFGSVDVNAATVQDILPPTLLNASWVCDADIGASCTPSGTGNIIDNNVSLPANTSVIYTLTADPNVTEADVISNTATVISPAFPADPDLSNNTAVDTDVIALFADGFEGTDG